MHWWDWVTMVSSLGAFLVAARVFRDQQRYPEFLRKKHEEAEARRKTVGYFGSYYPVSVDEGDLDLAFRAMAEDILSLEAGVWYCKAATFNSIEDENKA